MTASELEHAAVGAIRDELGTVRRYEHPGREVNEPEKLNILARIERAFFPNGKPKLPARES
jgi:hypothetical protein